MHHADSHTRTACVVFVCVFKWSSGPSWVFRLLADRWQGVRRPAGTSAKHSKAQGQWMPLGMWSSTTNTAHPLCLYLSLFSAPSLLLSIGVKAMIFFPKLSSAEASFYIPTTEKNPRKQGMRPFAGLKSVEGCGSSKKIFSVGTF